MQKQPMSVEEHKVLMMIYFTYVQVVYNTRLGHSIMTGAVKLPGNYKYKETEMLSTLLQHIN